MRRTPTLRGSLGHAKSGWMPKAPGQTYVRPLGPVAAMGWAAAMLIVLLIAVAIVAGVRPGSEYDRVNGTLLEVACVLLVVLAIARVHAPEARIGDLLGAHPVSFRCALLGSLMGVGMMLPMRALDGLISQRWPLPEPRLSELVHGLGSLGARERIVGSVVTALLAPIADELFFRGALATGIAHVSGRRVALIITAMSFALINAAGDLHFLPYFCVIGLIMGHARFAGGSVLATLAAALSWRGVDLAYMAWRYRSIDPLTTEIVTPVSSAPRWVVASALLTVAAATLLARFGVHDDTLTRGVPLTASDPPQRRPGGDSHGSGDDEEDDG